MWNERAANPVGSAPAETPEQPEPAYESKQDEPSRLDPATDPRTLEAPATDEEDPLASLPADFAAFSLTQTHPKSSDAKVEPFEQQRQRGPRVRRIYEKRVGAYARRYKTRMCIYGDACPYGPGRCFFAHDAAELRPPQARWWLPEYKTKPCRYAASECPFYADGRCQYAHTVRGPASHCTESRVYVTTQVEELQYVRPPPAKTQDRKYKTRMCRYGAGACPYGVSCSYAHSAVVIRVEF